MRPGTVIHSQATKDWTKKQLRLYGPDSVFGLPELTLADALQIVDDYPTEFLPVGDGCRNRDERGVCQGCPPKESL